jgi:cytochrome P450
LGQPATVEYSARTPPRVSGYPIVGALPGLIKGQFDFLESARRRYGDVYELDLGFTRATVLCHPQHAQHILLDNARNYTKGGPLWDSIRTFLGNGLPVSEGEFWKRQRRMMQPAFHHQRMAALTGRMVEAIDECLEGWEPAARSGEPLDVAQAFVRMTMHVLVRTVFGGSVEPAEAQQVGAGQRQCIGKEFALMEGQLILARIAQRYQVSAVPGREARLHLGTTLRAKDGVWVYLAVRDGRSSAI